MKPTDRTIGALTLVTLGLLLNVAGAAPSTVEKNLSKLNLPDGFSIDVYAEVPNARQMALGQSTGTVFVGTRGEKVYAVVDKDKDRKAEEVVTILDDLKVGNGVAMYQGNLYVAEQHRIARYPATGFDLNLPFAQMREVVYDQLPDKGHHGWRYIGFGPDNKLYVTVGAPCNVCAVSGMEGTIVRMDPDGANAEIYAKGVRNSVGLDFQPDTGALYFTDNGVDMMGDDIPSGELNAARKPGLHFGFPYYAGGDDRPAAWADKQPPQDVTFPVTEFQAHVANLGMKFYTGDMFPAAYQGNAIIARHGSWNRSSPVGYKLMRVRFDEQHNVIRKEVFIDGWLQNEEAWGRPTDVLQLPDGSLLISDDYNGVIYRVSYNGDSDTDVAAKEKSALDISDNGIISGLEMPESAIAHPDGRVFVSEVGSSEKDGDGRITVIDLDGNRTTLAESLNDPRGIDLWANALYAADVDRVVKVTMDGAVSVMAKASDFPGTAQLLNDIEIDGQGNVYVSDSGTKDGTNAGIYKITPAGEVSEVIGANAGIKRPNGLLLDGLGQMLVADFGSGDLFRLDLNSKKVTGLNQGFGGADGLVRDSRGYLYVSDWKNGKVWQLSDPQATPQLIGEGYKAAADIALATDGRHLLLPDMKAGELQHLPIQ